MKLKYKIEVDIKYDGTDLDENQETVSSLLQKAVQNGLLKDLPWKVLGRAAQVSYCIGEFPKG